MINNPIILFDGICNLCNGTVDFIINRDKKEIFRFAALQSDAGIHLAKKFDISGETDSVVLIWENQVFLESDAALEITRLLSFPWKAFVVFKILPKNIRDRIYRWIAKNRYGWFGKKNTCRIPTPEEASRFLSISDLKS
jgi:predicted DCC family thiol-disulfide oxidoreductase YuxK